MVSGYFSGAKVMCMEYYVKPTLREMPTHQSAIRTQINLLVLTLFWLINHKVSNTFA